MSPGKGSTHSRARSDSGAARLWQWARERRGPWTCPEAVEACAISPRRCRAIVAALYAAGVLDQVSESEVSDRGQAPATWRLSAAGRALAAPPIMVVDWVAGLITGVRAGAATDS